MKRSHCAAGLRHPVCTGLSLIVALLWLWLGVFAPARPVSHSDFPNYWLAGRLLLQGELDARIYDDQWLQQRGNQEAGLAGALYTFTPQPPPQALLLVPLGALPLGTAWRLLWGLKALLIGLGAWTLWRSFRWPAALALLVWPLTGFFLARDVALGQIYLPLLVALLGALAWLQRPEGRSRPLQHALAGAILGLITVTKLLTLPLLVILGWRRRWWALGGALVAGAGLVLASLLLLGAPVHASWLALLGGAADGALVSLFHPGVESLYALLLQLFVPHPVWNADAPLDALPVALWLWRGLRLGGLGVAAWWTWRAGREETRPGAPSTPLLLSGWLLCALLIAPIVTTYHELLALPALWWVAGRLWRRAGAPRGRTAQLGLVLLALAFLGAAQLQPHIIERWHRFGDLGWLAPLAFARLWLNLLLFVLLIGSPARHWWPLPLGLALAGGLALGGGTPGNPGHAPDAGEAVRPTPLDPDNPSGALVQRHPTRWSRPGTAPQRVTSAMPWDRYLLLADGEELWRDPEADLFEPVAGARGLAFTRSPRSQGAARSIWWWPTTAPGPLPPGALPPGPLPPAPLPLPLPGDCHRPSLDDCVLVARCGDAWRRHDVCTGDGHTLALEADQLWAADGALWFVWDEILWRRAGADSAAVLSLPPGATVHGLAVSGGDIVLALEMRDTAGEIRLWQWQQEELAMISDGPRDRDPRFEDGALWFSSDRGAAVRAFQPWSQPR